MLQGTVPGVRICKQNSFRFRNHLSLSIYRITGILRKITLIKSEGERKTIHATLKKRYVGLQVEKMSIKSINVFYDSKEQVEQFGTQGDKKALKESRNSIFAGELQIGQNTAEQQRKTAHQKAVDKLMDTFAQEVRIDQSVAKRVSHIDELSQQSDEYRKDNQRMQDEKKRLQEEYGLDDTSKEITDYKIYVKAELYNEDLTEEEQAQLDAMGPLTEFQQRCLDYDKMIKKNKNDMTTNSLMVEAEQQVIHSISLERLKSHAIADAKVAEEEAIKDAEKEIANMLLDEVKENVDENTQEVEEKQEEFQQEQEEKREQMGIDEPDVGIDINVMKNITKADEMQEEIQQKVMSMIQQGQITEEDVLGKQVDEKR